MKNNLLENLSSIEEIIEDAKNGKMYILVDDPNRENEGDLIIPAQMVTPEAINFMTKYGRGLVCLSLTKKRINELNLPLMNPLNQKNDLTAFTISIEAKDGITTGISAADRSHTISVAINGSRNQSDIVSPGHIFPLMAWKGGV
jgi:3,4-dihydroxy 2-butanone 4-phosphate synthase/GTP cyclohydrolase II